MPIDLNPGLVFMGRKALTEAVPAKLAVTGLFAATLMLPAVSALADNRRFGDTVSFKVGAMDHKGKGSVASTREDLPVDRLTFGDLGLGDDTGIIWAKFAWQFAEDLQLRLGYSRFDTSGFQVATASGNFDGIDWDGGAVLTSDLDMNFFIADINWDFYKGEKGLLGAGVGLHAADFDFDLLVEVFANVGGEDESGLIPIGTEEASALAPLPSLSLIGGYKLAEDVYLEARAGYLSLSYDRYDGSLLSVLGSVEWRAWKNAGLGVAYQYVDVEVDVENPSSTERYDLEFHGPVLFVSVGF
ncbi:MAG: hypothetical protein ACR2QI_01230 [Woeseiaceae bacterium]